MIERKFAREQLARLKCLPYPVTEELALKELEVALLTAENEFHASSCISHFTQYSSDRWPTPADIRRVLASTRTREAGSGQMLPEVKAARDAAYDPDRISRPGVTCPACGDWGKVLRDGIAVRCTCPAGLTLSDDTLASYNLGPTKPRNHAQMTSARDALAQICRVLPEREKTKKGLR